MKLRLFKRRHLWLPTWPVLIGVSVGSLLLATVLFFTSHDFLAITKPAPGAKVLVVESWLSDYSMERVARMAKAEDTPYEQIWLVGSKLEHGTHFSDLFDTYAEMGVATLTALDLPPDKLHPAPAASGLRHRTYNAAAALKTHLDERGSSFDRFDLITLDVHARRSRLVYHKVFPDADIGVIALSPDNYDPDDWYKTSSGMKNTIFEIIAYLYEKLADGGR